MRKWVAWACSISLLTPGIAFPGAAETQESDRYAPPVIAPQSGYCRTPSALPNLGPEVENQQESRPGIMRRSVRSSVESAPLAMTAPPPTSSSEVAEATADTVVVTGSGVDAPTHEVDVDRSLPRPIPPRPPQPRPQSGLLTAGEHDDLLNPELYEDYRRKANIGQMTSDMPVVDTARLLTVELRDNRGRAVPFADVELRCEDGNVITLKTVADGSVVFFPGLDRLSKDVWIRSGGSDWRAVQIADGAGGQTVQITQSEAAPRVRKLDLALVVDVTGSMSDELQYLQSELTSIIGDLENRHRNLDVRVAFTFYRDQGDQFVTRSFGFDGNVDRARGRLAQQYASGGGDYEEAMQDALVRAAQMDWRDDAAKTLLLVADAPPHNQDIAQTWLAAEHLRADRVHVVPVGASGVGDMAEYVMRAMAAVTQSRYTFLTDDSGIGNPHAEPAIDCYLVTRLDHLLRRVIDSQISGRRIEPERSEVIRSVGQYDAGRCMLPEGFGDQKQVHKGA